MRRIPEPELMDDPEQARAYAAADFAEPHERFVTLLREQLLRSGLDRLACDLVSDRHWIAWGRVP